MTGTPTRVPAGHQVTVYSASAQPTVARSNGGVVLANFGCAGDDPDCELEAILQSLAEAARADVTPTFLLSAGKPVRVSDLFVPAQPAALRLESPVLWVFHQGGAASLSSDERRIDLVIDRMRALKAKQTFQTLYLVEAPSRAVLRFVEAIRDVGVEIRRPDARDGSHAVLVEVHRPEGRILSALAGTPDAFAAADARDEQLIPLRSPRLGRLVLELHARNDGDVNEIVQALKARTLPLMLIVDPTTRGVAQRSFGNQVALPTFSDMPSLQRAARDMGLTANSYASQCSVLALSSRWRKHSESPLQSAHTEKTHRCTPFSTH